MSLTAREIGLVVSELSESITGWKLFKLHQLGDDDFSFHFSSRKEREALYVSFAPGLVRLHLAAERVKGPASPTGFARALRKWIDPSKLVSIDQVGGDRVVVLELAKKDGRFKLYFELIGSRPNVVLADEAGVIIALLHRDKRARKRLAKENYYTPPDKPETIAEVENLPPAPNDVSFNEHVADKYRARIDTARFSERLREVEKAYESGTKRIRAKIAKLEEGMRQSAESGEYKRIGDLILAQLDRIPSGAAEALLDDFAGGEVAVKLDPDKSARKNADAYFKKHGKLARSADYLGAMIAEEKARLEAIEEECFPARIKKAVSAPELDAIMNEFKAHKLVGEKPSKKAPQKNLGPRKFRSRNGCPILVGRSQVENDKLTLKVAKANDLWLHAAGAAGSHVVVRMQKKEAVPRETLIDAALLAMYYSKARGRKRAEIHYCRRKDVRKPKGAKPGLVHLTDYETILVDADPVLLKKLLETRAESG